MKTRIISAVVGIPIVLIILFFYNTIVLNIAVAIISILGVYEILHETRYVKNPAVLITSLIYAGIIPFTHQGEEKELFALILMIYVIILVIILFIHHSKLKFQEIATAFTCTLLVPYAFSSIVFVREIEPDIAIHSIVTIFLCAWVSDSGAYFTGVFFGKTKLAPTISPKKTVEGAIGGVVFCILINVIFTYVYVSIASNSTLRLEVQLLPLLIITLIGSLVGIVGDLTASIIKRQRDIKDFGKIMPGHGGILDRCDSVLFIAPFLYIVLQVFPIIKVV